MIVCYLILFETTLMSHKDFIFYTIFTNYELEITNMDQFKKKGVKDYQYFIF